MILRRAGSQWMLRRTGVIPVLGICRFPPLNLQALELRARFLSESRPQRLDSARPGLLLYVTVEQQSRKFCFYEDKGQSRRNSFDASIYTNILCFNIHFA